MSSLNAPINRSQSLLASKGRIPVLAPSRGDRARLEALLADVWTRETLPFPGMTAWARNEHLIRTSAHSMIRKLSVTSIASTFTKRSASLASITRGGSDEELGEDEGTSAVAEIPAIAAEEPQGPSHIYLDNEDGHEKSRLSIIEDVSDHATPSTIRSNSINIPSSTESPQSPRRRMRLTKRPSAWQLKEPEALSSSPSTPNTVLYSKPVNGPQLKRQASLLSRKSVRSVCSAIERVDSGRGSRKRRAAKQPKDDDIQEGQQQPLTRFSISPSSTSTSPLKSSSPSLSGNRWSRVDLLRRGAVAQGIRGFFQQ